MKKILFFFAFLVVFLAPQLAMAQLVPCGNEGQTACTFLDFFQLLVNVYNFIIWDIATPLAVLIIAIGGVLMLISGGNPGLASKGKDMIKWAVIAILLIWGGFLIISTILAVIGSKWGVNPPF